MKTLVIAAHMDDEVLATGALILARNREGADVSVMTLFTRKYADGVDRSGVDQQAFFAAHEVLGGFSAVNKWHEEGEPGRVGHYALLTDIERHLQAFKPDEVVIPGRADLNQDHRHLNEVCRIALRPGNLGSVKRIMEALAHDTFDGLQQANYGVSLGGRDAMRVMDAMRKYESEVRTPPHPRSFENMWARYRLYGAQFGVEYAEPYRVIMEREI